MSTNEQAGLTGHVHALLTDRYGFVKEERDGPNIIVAKGREDTVRLLASVSAPAAFQWVALGTGVTAATTADAALVAELTTLGGPKYLSTRTIVSQTTTKDRKSVV
jgi:hypothetical protein